MFFGWVATEKRPFFAVVVCLILVEAVIVYVLAKSEHERFDGVHRVSPLPSASTIDVLRPSADARPSWLSSAKGV
jgi:hypothetical protein